MELKSSLINSQDASVFMKKDNNYARKLYNDKVFFLDLLKRFDATSDISLESLKTIIKTSDESERESLCELLFNNISPSNSKEVFLACQIIYVMLVEMESINKKEYQLLLSTLEKIDTLNTTNVEDDYSSAANTMLKKVGTVLLQAKEHFENDSDVSSDDVKFLASTEIHPQTIGENASTIDYDCHSVTFRTESVPEIDDMINYLRNYQYGISDSDAEFFIANIYRLPTYVHYVLNANDIQQNYYDTLQWIIMQTYSLVKNNRNGLEKLYTALIQIHDDIKEMIAYPTFESKETSDKLLDLIDKLLTSIENSHQDVQDMTHEDRTSPLIEMGLGYFYDDIPIYSDNLSNEDWDRISMKLSEDAIKYNALKNLKDSINIMNEMTEEEKEYKKQRARQKSEDRYEMKKQIAQARTENKIQKINQKAEMKRRNNERENELKNQNNQRDADADFERAEEKRKKKLVSRDANIGISAEKIRSLPLTSSAAYAAKNALSRAITAACVGGAGALAGVNPIIGASLFLITKFITSKSDAGKVKERAKLVSSIDREIETVDSKISDAESAGNAKLATGLRNIKGKLTTTRNRIVSNIEHSGGSVIV